MFKTIVTTGILALGGQQLGQASVSTSNFLASEGDSFAKTASSIEITRLEGNEPISTELTTTQKPFENPCVVSQENLKRISESLKKISRIGSNKYTGYLLRHPLSPLKDDAGVENIANRYNYYLEVKDKKWHNELPKKIMSNLDRFMQEIDEMGFKWVEYLVTNNEFDKCTEEMLKHIFENHKIAKERKALVKSKFNIDL